VKDARRVVNGMKAKEPRGAGGEMSKQGMPGCLGSRAMNRLASAANTQEQPRTHPKDSGKINPARARARRIEAEGGPWKAYSQTCQVVSAAQVHLHGCDTRQIMFSAAAATHLSLMLLSRLIRFRFPGVETLQVKRLRVPPYCTLHCSGARMSPVEAMVDVLDVLS
jgi:hypothetical protein